MALQRPEILIPRGTVLLCYEIGCVFQLRLTKYERKLPFLNATSTSQSHNVVCLCR